MPSAPEIIKAMDEISDKVCSYVPFNLRFKVKFG